MRKLSQEEVLQAVLNNWHHGIPNPRFGPSVLATARFLWAMVVAALILVLLALIVQLYPKGEEHCDDGARTRAGMECAQELQATVAGKGQGVGHGVIVPISDPMKYVHGRLP